MKKFLMLLAVASLMIASVGCKKDEPASAIDKMKQAAEDTAKAAEKTADEAKKAAKEAAE